MGRRMANSGDDDGSGFTIKDMRPEHVEDAGRALFTAFYVDSLATGVPPTYNVASPEQGSSLLESFLSQPAVYKVVAVDAAGKVLGGACMQSGTQHVLMYCPANSSLLCLLQALITVSMIICF